MERALGIGGVFVRAREPTALADWYAANLGIAVMDPQGYRFELGEPAAVAD